MNQDGTLDTPRMPVAEHRRRLGNVLFQFTNGFGQVIRSVADAAGPLASLGLMFDEAVDPRRDPRPDADGIFNPAFVDIPDPVKQSARDHRRTVHVTDVRAAWTRCEWGHMALRAAHRRDGDVGAQGRLHGGAAAPGHEARRVPRERELRVPGVRVPGRGGGGGGAVGQHRHRVRRHWAPPVLPDPVWSPNDDGTPFVEVLVWEPQADEVVPHVDVARHYTGRQGFAILI